MGAIPLSDIGKTFIKKWHHKNAHNEVVRFDIQRTDELINGFDDSEYGKYEGLDKLIGGKKVDIIVGGPPCQAYSLAGRIRDEHGMKNDYRNYLFESYIHIVKHFRPEFFVFENVVGLLSAAPDGYPIVEKIRKEFIASGYNVAANFKDTLFEVADFGIPQHRKRVIIVGIRLDAFGDSEQEALSITNNMIDEFYNVLMPSYKKAKRTVKEAIGDLPPIYPLDEPVKEGGKNSLMLLSRLKR